MRWERFQLDLPDDFPVSELEAVHAHLSDPSKTRGKSRGWGEWAGACNGIVYRYLACDEHAVALAESLGQNIAPQQPERYRQERLLFSFFVEGLSCIECFYYGFYFVGAMIDPAAFDPEVDGRKVTTARVVRGYRGRFRNERLTASLQAVNASAEMVVWRDVRNILAHRASPGRGFFEGGPRSGEADWLGANLSSDTVHARRSWLADIMVSLLEPAAEFVQREVV